MLGFKKMKFKFAPDTELKRLRLSIYFIHVHSFLTEFLIPFGLTVFFTILTTRGEHYVLSFGSGIPNYMCDFHK